MGTAEDFFYWMVPKLSNEMKDKYNLHRFISKENLLEDVDKSKDSNDSSNN